MPHSSGGGSHGGGYHSSSSSSSYHSSGGGSHGGGYTSPYVSKTPYSGAKKYVYYNRINGHRSYYYYKGDPQKNGSLSSAILGGLVLSLLAGFIIYIILFASIFIPQKITPAKDTEIYIEDQVGVISDKDRLYNSMKAFQDKTGITPGIQIVDEENWENYADLETYALSEYMRLFDDEKHWLFVISYPRDYANSEFVNWEWEGMAGDYIGPAVNSDSESKFTKIIHKHLLRTEPGEVGKEMATAFDEYTGVVFEKQISFGGIVFSIIVVVIYLAMLYKLIEDAVIGQRIKSAVMISNKARELACEYCGGIYVEGTVTKCPNCGALIPYKKKEDDKKASK